MVLNPVNLNGTRTLLPYGAATFILLQLLNMKALMKKNKFSEMKFVISACPCVGPIISQR